MLLKTILVLNCALWAGTASAELSIPGLQKKSYKLTSFSKSLRGKKKESAGGRDKFCGERINPKITEDNGKLNLELNPGLGYEWRSIDENPPELTEGCRYPVTQKVESVGDRSELVLVNGEDCGHRKPVVGSQRDTLQLNGAQITYTSESVVKNRAGGWDTNHAKESFSCVWTAD